MGNYAKRDRRKAEFQPFEGFSTGSESRHARITLSMVKNPAWKKLKPIAVKLYVYLKMKYRGTAESIRFTCTYKEVNAVLGLSDKSIKAAFTDLIEKGFIEVEEDNSRRMRANIYRFSDKWKSFHAGGAMTANNAKRIDLRLTNKYPASPGKYI